MKRTIITPLSVALWLLAILMAVPLKASAIESTPIVTYYLWVGDTQVTDENKDDVLGDGTISFTPGIDGGTLTITTAQPAISGTSTALIKCEDMNLTINAPNGLELKHDQIGYGVAVYTGSLTINGNLSGGMVNNEILVNNGDLKVEGNIYFAHEQSCGISVNGNVDIVGDVNISAKSHCIEANTIKVKGNLTVSSHDRSLYPISSNSGGLTVEGNVTGTNKRCVIFTPHGDVNIIGNVTLKTTEGSAVPLYCNNVNIKGNVNITLENNGSGGISGTDITIDGDVKISGAYTAISASVVTMVSGRWELDAIVYAVSCTSMTIPDTHEIIVPAGGSFSQRGIVDANGHYVNYAYIGKKGDTAPGIAIDATNFPDEAFRNYLLSQNYGLDGVITPQEMKNITEINVQASIKEDEIDDDNDKSRSLQGIRYPLKQNRVTANNQQPIKSLQGIEFFTALKHLNCFQNQLTTLDLSSNTALETLICEYNQLTTLKLPESTTLKTVSCYKNQLATLDVSKNTALESLYCNDNQLTTLTLPESATLKHLSCARNQLTSLDVTNYTALEIFNCEKNQLTTLTLPESTALMILICDNNQLTSLELSNNTKLFYLTCFSNQIKDAGMDALVTSLPMRQDGDNTGLCAIDATDEHEGNVMTTKQVEAAKQKGWKVLYWRSNDDNEWQEYAGTAPVPDGIRNARNGNGDDDKLYNLQGRRVERVAKKGVFIKNGKKVIRK